GAAPAPDCAPDWESSQTQYLVFPGTLSKTIKSGANMHTDIDPRSLYSPTPAAGADSLDAPLSAMAPGQLRVIKRNGAVVTYDESKIVIAITKAFLAVEG